MASKKSPQAPFEIRLTTTEAAPRWYPETVKPPFKDDREDIAAGKGNRSILREDPKAADPVPYTNLRGGVR